MAIASICASQFHLVKNHILEKLAVFITDVRRSPKTDRRASIKTKDKGKAAGDPAGDEEAAAPPPPLEVHVKVKLHHWKTAMDSIRDEEQAQAAIAEAAAAAAAENGAD